MVEKADFCILVPSKGRSLSIREFILKNNIEKYQIFVSVEKQEIVKYKKELSQFDNVDIIKIDNDCGVGAARNKLLFSASAAGYEYCLFMDDNSFINIHYTNKYFLEKIKNDEAIAVGLWSSIYELFFGLKGEKDFELYPVKFSSVVFFLKTKILDDGINFDERFIMCEDNELFCRLRARYGKTAVKTIKKLYYKKKRHQPGGCTENKKREVLEKFCKTINDEIGEEIITLPKDTNKTSYRFAWKKYERLLYENNSN